MSTCATRRALDRRPPGPRGAPLVGVLAHGLRNPLRFLTEVSRRYGDVVSLNMGLRTVCLVSHPDDVKHVLHDNHRNYGKGDTIAMVRRIHGKSVATTEGDVWRSERRRMQPVFHRDRVLRMADIVTHAANDALERWRLAEQRRQPIAVDVEMRRIAAAVIVKSMFGVDPPKETERALAALSAVQTPVSRHVLTGLPPMRIWEFHRILRELDQLISSILEARSAKSDGRDDLLSILFDARDEQTGERMGAQQLRDEVLTIFAAGHETVATTLAWIWYQLSINPAVERRLHTELATMLRGRAPAAADLGNLAYTRMVIEETLRLYPPVWSIPRLALADDEISGYHIPGGSHVLLSPYVTHRRLELWENPEGFDPDRFAPGRSDSRPAFAYFPFGGGPRRCIGSSFAMTEIPLVVATIAQRYGLELLPGHPVVPRPLISLRPRHGLPMTLRARTPDRRSAPGHFADAPTTTSLSRR